MVQIKAECVAVCAQSHLKDEKAISSEMPQAQENTAQEPILVWCVTLMPPILD